VSSSPETERLKRRLIRGAVDRNIDEMHGLVPSSLLPIRRLLALWKRRSMIVALPLVFLVGTFVLSSFPASGVAPSRPATPSDHALPAAERPPVLPPGAFSGPQPMRPTVLGLKVRRVVVDAGHGGANLGTKGANGLAEKVLTLDIAHRLQRLIVDGGLEAVMTREDDETVSLETRAGVANGNQGDIFVSIHLNSLKPTTDLGIETYYLGPTDDPALEALVAAENRDSGYSLSDMRALLEKIYVDARRDQSRRLAQAVQRALVRHVRQINPAVSNRGVKTAPFVVLVATEMPAILAEVACLSNVEEAERLRAAEYRQTIADALFAGIRQFAQENQGG
jgi:N-acetylmuramoyl-L-alanine amidase